MKMIYSLKENKNRFIERLYQKAMNELNEFYGLNWKRNLPKIIVLKDRKEIDKFWGSKTERWLVAFARNGIIFILNWRNYEKESLHKYSKEDYYALLKHELGHLFFGHLSGGNNNPSWLNEGTQLLISNQLKNKKPIKKFSKFMEHYDYWEKDVYEESGFAVELLVKKFGKRKLIKLIQELRASKSEKDFKKLFKRIYGFNLNYKNMNNYLN